MQRSQQQGQEGQGSSSTPPPGSGSDGGGGGGKKPRTKTMKPVAAAHLAALRGRYELLRSKGNGSFADVWEARHLRTGHRVAVKIISHAKLADEFAGDVDREIAAMRLLRHHPHIAHLHEAIRGADHTYIVMELAASGDLYDYVDAADRSRLSEPEARRIFRQLVAGVAFRHRNMVVHRDLKLDNVLLDADGNVKVADFGLSDVWSHERLLSRSCGSPEYVAPEVMEGRHYRGPEVDVWSCGVILYVMLSGRMPFEGADLSDVARKVRRGSYVVPAWVSDDARDLIAGMLVVRQEKRATIAEVMAHRWLSSPADTPPFPPYLRMMPPPDAAALRARARVAAVDADAVELLVTRHGFERNAGLIESLRLDDESSEVHAAAVAYQLVLRNKYGAAALYQQLLSMPPPPPAEMAPRRRQWVLGGGLNGGELLLHECPCTTMRRIARALRQLGVRILSYHSHRMACAHIASDGGGGSDATFRSFLHRQNDGVGGDGGASRSSSASVRSAATFRSFLRHNDGGASSSLMMSSSAPEMSNNILRSLSAAVIFEIELFKAGEGEHDPQQQRQYALHLKRTSGPQLPYLRVCSQLASKLRPQIS
ncbi:hypothetical protein HU200_022712 [Digitaria exilis]|uniref:Non-specific serine/threonine protein kinase n=1 Tax=Digitaria exilis TaxID=1010633 RepID=A0A835C675_9POAL|nr:hypothetical protein HU200_022712 [Digitaria exilis]